MLQRYGCTYEERCYKCCYVFLLSLLCVGVQQGTFCVECQMRVVDERMTFGQVWVAVIDAGVGSSHVADNANMVARAKDLRM